MIYVGADHCGLALKEKIQTYLEELGLEVEDMGAFKLNKDDDYPDFVFPVAKKVAEAPQENLGIVIGRSGQGEAIAANKVKGVRAALYYGGSMDIIKLSRQHNATNVLSLGADFLSAKQAKEAVSLWLETKFEGARHKRRVGKITDFESA